MLQNNFSDDLQFALFFCIENHGNKDLSHRTNKKLVHTGTEVSHKGGSQSAVREGPPGDPTLNQDNDKTGEYVNILNLVPGGSGEGRLRRIIVGFGVTRPWPEENDPKKVERRTRLSF